MKLWPLEKRQFLYIQVCLLVAVILWLAFAHMWLLKAIAIAALMWLVLFVDVRSELEKIQQRGNRSEIRQFYIFLGLMYLFMLWLVIALKFDRLHPR